MRLFLASISSPSLLWHDRIQARRRFISTAQAAVHDVSVMLLIMTALLIPLMSNSCCVSAAEADMIDLASAVVVAPEDLSAREKKAVTLLTEEVERRTQLRWQVS